MDPLSIPVINHFKLLTEPISVISLLPALGTPSVSQLCTENNQREYAG